MSAQPVPADRTRVVIVGGGFAGLWCARGLARAPADVVLLDRTNYHVFQPLLYQVATAALASADIGAPIRKILRRQANVTVLMANARAIDPALRVVLHDGGEQPYDRLVLATGARNAYFGHDDWRPHAPGLKTFGDALEIRRRILAAFERAELAGDAGARAPLLTFCVVGGGPTGVELAGALSEIARRTLARDFRRFDPAEARVVLLEGGPRLLPSMTPASSERALRALRRMGVEVRTGALVTDVDGGGLRAGGARIDAATVIWAAGVAAEPVTASLGVPLDGAGRVIVDALLHPPGHGEITVVGDAMAASSGGAPVPGMAPAAIQSGRAAAANIARELAGRPPRPFVYRDAGALATIGRSAAVAEIGRVRLSGWPAWMLWVAVHITFLIGFRNRAVVMFEWAWAWLTFQRSARVMLDPRGRDD